MRHLLSFGSSLSNLPLITDDRTRSISAENPEGIPGSGGKEGSSRKGRPCLEYLVNGKTYTLADIKGPAIIQSFWVTVPAKTDFGSNVLRDLILRIFWDEEKSPSVEVPLGDFFCCGFARRTIINSLPIVVNPFGGFNCYFPMPFKKRAIIEIENQHPGDIPAFFYQINYCLQDKISHDAGYFHAQWRRENPTVKEKDYTILDNVIGKGHYVGTYLGVAALEENWWGEGEIKFYIDNDELYPTICGTGTEDYFGGAWCYTQNLPYGDKKAITYSTSFLGYPYNSKTDNFYGEDIVSMHGQYRWHIPDPVRFLSKLRVTIQQMGWDPIKNSLFERKDDVSSVAYWYQSEPHNPYQKLPEVKKRWPTE